MKTRHIATAYLTLAAFCCTSCVAPQTRPTRSTSLPSTESDDSAVVSSRQSSRLPSGTFFFFEKEGLKYAYLYKVNVQGTNVSGYVIQRSLEDVDYESGSPDASSSSDSVCAYTGSILSDDSISVSFNDYPPYNLPSAEGGGRTTKWTVSGTSGAWKLVVPTSVRSQDGTNQYSDTSITASQTELPAEHKRSTGNENGELIVAAGLAIGAALILWGGAKLLGKGRDMIAEGARISSEHTDTARAAGAYKCPRCDGYGRIDVAPTRITFDTCPRCDGNGWLKDGLPFNPRR